jgi:hypothetical protein
MTGTASTPSETEASMATVRRRYIPVLTVVFIALTSLSASAEKMDCPSSKQRKENVSRQAIQPGDRQDRELVQFVRVDVLSSKNPEWDAVEQTVYGHLDHIRGTGTHTGYAVTTLKSGEKLWVRWEGTHYTVPKSDAWESYSQGVFRFIAGTGKYKAIRGGGSYQGSTTPADLNETILCEAEY